MSAAAQAEVVIEVTTATHPTPHEIVATALEEPAIKEAIQRGIRKVRVKKYAAVTKSGRDGVCEHISDFVQATYLALLEHPDEFAALPAEERPQFVEKLAMSVSWKGVYPMKREVPLAEPFDGDEADSEASPHPPPLPFIDGHVDGCECLLHFLKPHVVCSSCRHRRGSYINLEKTNGKLSARRNQTLSLPSIRWLWVPQTMNVPLSASERQSGWGP